MPRSDDWQTSLPDLGAKKADLIFSERLIQNTFLNSAGGEQHREEMLEPIKLNKRKSTTNLKFQLDGLVTRKSQSAEGILESMDETKKSDLLLQKDVTRVDTHRYAKAGQSVLRVKRAIDRLKEKTAAGLDKSV